MKPAVRNDGVHYSLDRPIFVVGHARGGSTMLAAIINWHSMVGPKYDPLPQFASIHDFLAKIQSYDFHLHYSRQLEQKEIWFEHFPGADVYMHMGKELIVEDPQLSPLQIAGLLNRLVRNDFNQSRFLSKAPSNSFRVKAIRRLFPDAKIIAIYRRGEEVVASWMNRPAARNLSVRESIRIFGGKWLDTLEYLESMRKECDILPLTYDQLVLHTPNTLKRILEFLELPIEDYVFDVRLNADPARWKKSIPIWHRRLLRNTTARGNSIIQRVDIEED